MITGPYDASQSGSAHPEFVTRAVPAGPAVQAAKRARENRRALRSRPYPVPHDDDGTGDAVALAVTRALLLAVTREEVAAILRTAVHDLGGSVLPARLADVRDDVLPVDVSLGTGEPMLVVADPIGMAAMRLTQHLALLVQDATTAAARCDVAHHQDQRASVDGLTGVSSRTEIGPRLAEAHPGDVICMLDLDRFKALNDTEGHAAGDRALTEFGGLLRRTIRTGDFCGRYGGDEFLIVLAAAPVDAARERMQELVRAWSEDPWHGTTVSVGLAVVDEAGGPAAALHADQALYQAKHSGRARVHLATEPLSDLDEDQP